MEEMSEHTDELIETILDLSDNRSYTIKSIAENLACLDKRKASAKELKSSIEKIEHELVVCKHASKVMCELYDRRCQRITAIEAAIAEQNGNVRDALSAALTRIEILERELKVARDMMFDSVEELEQEANHD